jgi:hypothetical protein
MRAVQSVPSGQWLLEGIEAVQTIRRGDLWARPGARPPGEGAAARARAAVVTLHRLAGDLRLGA